MPDLLASSRPPVRFTGLSHGIAAAIVGSVWNYAVSGAFTWRGK